MDYKNKHREEIVRATQLWERGDITRENLEYIFPELNEDERIRNVIRGWIYTRPASFFDNGISKEEILAWLEKQGDKDKLIKELGEYKVKYTQEVLSQQLEKAMVDAGYTFDFDKKELKKNPNALEECEIEHIEHGKYYYCIKDYYSGGCKRASKGEVVQALRGMNMMALGVKANEYFIPVKCIVNVSPAWSEEDEKMYQSIVDDTIQECQLSVKQIEWLKSLRPQNRWKPSDKQLRAFLDTLEVKEVEEKFECPNIKIKDAIEVSSRMKYIDEDLKPIADFIMDYASWNLHKDEWNQPVLEVPLFRVLDALAQRGKPYCCAD